MSWHLIENPNEAKKERLRILAYLHRRIQAYPTSGDDWTFAPRAAGRAADLRWAFRSCIADIEAGRLGEEEK